MWRLLSFLGFLGVYTGRGRDTADRCGGVQRCTPEEVQINEDRLFGASSTAQWEVFELCTKYSDLSQRSIRKHTTTHQAAETARAFNWKAIVPAAWVFSETPIRSMWKDDCCVAGCRASTLSLQDQRYIFSVSLTKTKMSEKLAIIPSKR